MENFEKASKIKLRFETTKGFISTEELWDLNLTALDNIAKSVNKKRKEEVEESFITTKSSSNQILDLQLEILKHIISVKQNEMQERENKIKKSEEIDFLKKLLAEKKNEELKNLSAEEIAKRLSDLNA